MAAPGLGVLVGGTWGQGPLRLAECLFGHLGDGLDGLVGEGICLQLLFQWGMDCVLALCSMFIYEDNEIIFFWCDACVLSFM